MPCNRLPRKFLTSWVASPRPTGQPPKTWGATLDDALQAAGISVALKEWAPLCRDRSTWRKLIKGTWNDDLDED